MRSAHKSNRVLAIPSFVSITSREIKRRQSFVSRFRGRHTLRAIRITKGTRYDFMRTIYFVGHYFYRAVSEMDKIANGFTGVRFFLPPCFQEIPVCERMKFPRDGRVERDRNSKNERLLASTDRRPRVDFATA